ncbi:hypothetical protein ABK040_000291 [Willaertia magna]
MLFALTSVVLSIVIMIRKNVPIGFTIIRTLTLAIMFCFFCGIINCFFLPIKLRQSKREMSRANGNVRYDYNHL